MSERKRAFVKWKSTVKHKAGGFLRSKKPKQNRFWNVSISNPWEGNSIDDDYENPFITLPMPDEVFWCLFLSWLHKMHTHVLHQNRWSQWGSVQVKMSLSSKNYDHSLLVEVECLHHLSRSPLVKAFCDKIVIKRKRQDDEPSTAIKHKTGKTAKNASLLQSLRIHIDKHGSDLILWTVFHPLSNFHTFRIRFDSYSSEFVHCSTILPLLTLRLTQRYLPQGQ